MPKTISDKIKKMIEKYKDMDYVSMYPNFTTVKFIYKDTDSIIILKEEE